jgi:hypothetical protein
MPTHYQIHGKKHYEANKAKIIARVRVYNDTQREKWIEYKASLACANCGASHPAIFDFHHIDRHDPDKQSVNKLVQNKRYSAAYKEIEERCIVLCANCHRIHHYNEHKQKNTPESESSGVA